MQRLRFDLVATRVVDGQTHLAIRDVIPLAVLPLTDPRFEFDGLARAIHRAICQRVDGWATLGIAIMVGVPVVHVTGCKAVILGHHHVQLTAAIALAGEHCHALGVGFKVMENFVVIAFACLGVPDIPCLHN